MESRLSSCCHSNCCTEEKEKQHVHTQEVKQQLLLYLIIYWESSLFLTTNLFLLKLMIQWFIRLFKTCRSSAQQHWKKQHIHTLVDMNHSGGCVKLWQVRYRWYRLHHQEEGCGVTVVQVLTPMIMMFHMFTGQRDVVCDVTGK